MDKKQVAKKLNLTVDEVNYLLLDAGLQDDPESSEALSTEEFEQLQTIIAGTQPAIATSDNCESALAQIPVADIAQQTGLQQENIEGMVTAIWEIQTTRIIVEAQKLQELEESARLDAQARALERKLTTEIKQLQRAIAYDPLETLGLNNGKSPESEKARLAEKTAQALAVCTEIRGKLGKSA